ncbi:DUF916 and DUF3324 domain-containing protein [Marinilactibacillus kalidii]|uniref:DUF916 and DUF3324 domain-containing protein n=1 Tax=Marinilactibacillus kalidii TaxID=2820274 RepID=UPI001ABE4610|nr:DUF916 and DUF3324 domain-containing protein [Marinilactibacillus kalidii]
MNKVVLIARWLLLLVVISLIGSTKVVFAEEGVAFSVRAVLPDNQRDLNQSYFDLRIEPRQVQEIETQIENSSDEEIVVEVQLNDATTNSNGVIVYDDPEAIAEGEHPLTSIAELNEKEIAIKPGETASVFTNIKAPEQSFDGVILGGIRFQEKKPATVEGNEGVAIINDYAYIIGLQLSENDNEIQPSVELKSIEPGLSNYRTAVIAHLQNVEPMILKDLMVSAEVYKGDTLVHSVEQEDVRIAPETSMPIVIDWEDKAIEAGDYRMVISAKNDSDEWTFDEDFTISSEQEDEVNEEAVVIVEDANDQMKLNPTLLYVIIIVLFIAIALLIAYILRMRRSTGKHAK